MTTIPITEAKQKLEALSEQAYQDGRIFGLTEGKRVVALLTPPQARPSPAEQRKWPTGAEMAERISRWERMSLEESEAFARDVEEAIKEGNRINPDIPWPS